MAFDYSEYIRPGKLPHILCPGCGHGVAMKSMIRAIDKLKLNKDKVCVVSGIGCCSRIPGYVDFNTLHTTHGRALAFATGVKHANPELETIVISGDGDATAIGGNHFIHACRRNINITLLVFNNFIYGMTGGQFSPTTPTGMIASTTPYGNPDPPFDISKLAIAAGATFVARSTTYHATAMESLIKRAIQHNGFSLVEVMSGCPTSYGRKNKLRTPAAMMEWQKEHAVSVDKAKDMSQEELEGKFTTGLLHQVEREEYTDAYTRLVDRVLKSEAQA